MFITVEILVIYLNMLWLRNLHYCFVYIVNFGQAFFTPFQCYKDFCISFSLIISYIGTCAWRCAANRIHVLELKELPPAIVGCFFISWPARPE